MRDYVINNVYYEEGGILVWRELQPDEGWVEVASKSAKSVWVLHAGGAVSRNPNALAVQHDPREPDGVMEAYSTEQEIPGDLGLAIVKFLIEDAGRKKRK